MKHIPSKIFTNHREIIALLLGLLLSFTHVTAQTDKGGIMQTLTSKDGTTISVRQTGQEPVIVLVDGAMQYSAFDQSQGQLAKLLAEHFTVIQYDRRGRGESTDTLPYAVAREIEDIEALIDEAGGSAFVYGISSGAALAMEAAIALPDKTQKLAVYEPPYNDDATAQQAWQNFTKELGDLLAAVALILPGITRIMTWATPLAAVGLMIVSGSASVFHLLRGETSSALTTAILFVMCAFVAYMRWRVQPLLARRVARVN
jgi:pimeloyl-ACP methyl ester carboxylesterase